MSAASIPGQMLDDTCEADAAAAAGTPGQVQEDNCEADARPWSPDSEDDYSDMPSLANASPATLSETPSLWNPPALSPVRNFLAVPQQGSIEDPQQMDLDDSDNDAMPALLSVSDFNIQLRPTIPWSPYPWAQPQTQQQGQQASDDERRERANLLNAFRQMRPPRATGPRSRPSSRRTTGPQTARTSWLMSPAPGPSAAQLASLASPSRNPVDALYASAVQQVFSRTARLSADLLGGSFASEMLLRQGNEQRQQQRQQEEQQEYLQMQQVEQVPLCAEVCQAPAACSFLQPGMAFSGQQKLLQQGSNRQGDQWTVRVVLHDVDLSRGHVSGSMQSLDVEGAAGPIGTFFEGHIIDDVHNTFWTQTWGASRENDLRHWSKFDGFAGIKPLVLRHAGRCGQLQHHPTIFMRWKEQFFVNTKEDCGLTIAGFYYVALDRSTGALRGLYYDPSSSPFQELSLQVEQSSSGAASSRRSSASTAGSANGDSRMSSSSGGSSAGSIDSSGVSFGTFSFA